MYIYDHILSGPYQRTRDGLGAIIGADARQRVRDSIKAPYRWICALDLYFPSPTGGNVQRQRGTGLLISPRHVLTAAHNVLVHDYRDPSNIKKIWALRIMVYPGLDGTKLLGSQRAPVGSQLITPAAPPVSADDCHHPVGFPVPANWWVPPQFEPKGDLAWDFALLTLPKDLPSLHGMTYGYWTDARYAPWTKIAAVTASALVGSTVFLSGYPADKCKNDACAPCVPSKQAGYDSVRGKQSWASTQWEAGGTVQPDPPPGQILYDADACSGMSGSPVWQKKMVNKVEILELIAIHNGAYERPISKETFNRGVLLDAPRLDFLRQLMICDRERAKF